MSRRFNIQTAMRVPGIVAVILLSFIIWSFVMTVDGGVSAPGTITSVSGHQVISHLEGGVIKEVLVSEGQTVKKGQALVVVENLTFSEKLDKSLNIILALEPKIMRLKSELLGIDYKPSQDNKYSQQELELFSRRHNKLLSELAVLKDKITQNKSEKNFQNNSYNLLSKEINALSKDLDIAKKLVKLGASSANEISIAKKSLIQAKNRINEVSSNIERAKNNIQRLNSEIKLKKDSFLNTTQTELDKTNQQLSKAKTTYNIVKTRKTRSILKAVEAGVVYKLWTPITGMVVQAGKAIIEIATNDTNTEVVSKVKITDRDKIWIGMRTKILISHWKLSSRPIEAEVTDISADSFTNEKTGESYYKVTTVAKDIDNTTYKQLLVGMIIEVFYVSGNNSIASYLVHPMSKGIVKVMSEPIL